MKKYSILLAALPFFSVDLAMAEGHKVNGSNNQFQTNPSHGGEQNRGSQGTKEDNFTRKESNAEDAKTPEELTQTSNPWRKPPQRP